VQVKSSVTGMMSFLAVAIKFREQRRKFIPLCVGEPGAKEEMVGDLKRYGAWIGKEIPGRNELLPRVAQVRSLCGV
jgi:hypothetical protein